MGHLRRSYCFKLLGQDLISASKNWEQRGFRYNVVKRTLQLLKRLRLRALMSGHVQFPPNVLSAPLWMKLVNFNRCDAVSKNLKFLYSAVQCFGLLMVIRGMAVVTLPISTILVFDIHIRIHHIQLGFKINGARHNFDGVQHSHQ